MDSYTKVRIIGTGSFGTVWLIRSKVNQRNYVLKEIPLAMVQEKERAFVLNEVQVLSRLRHKNIIRYKEAFLNNGLLCISMEFAHEGDLLNKIQKQCGCMFLKEQVLDWFIQLCLSLKYIHGMNILHRDIKSQNIFLTKDSVIKLGDFGISCVLQNTLDHAQTVIGTPYYLSPEICQRQPYNHKSDIWALGCVLYEMITLTHPFESPDFTGLVLKILHGDYTPIPESHGPLLSDLVTVLLRVKPGERPSAKQILHIPAMQPYVDKVLARGRTQRSESVSSAGDELPSGRVGRNIWRKPDLMPVGNVRYVNQESTSQLPKNNSRCRRDCHDSDGVKKIRVSPYEWKSKDLEKSFEDLSNRQEIDSAPRREVGNKRKHVSSETCSNVKCNQFSDERISTSETETGAENCFDEVLEVDKENLTVQPGHTKSRSYSTSIVRECTERKPVIPLKKPPVRLRETYDVIPSQRQFSQETYDVIPNQRQLSQETYDVIPNQRQLSQETYAIKNSPLSKAVVDEKTKSSYIKKTEYQENNEKYPVKQPSNYGSARPRESNEQKTMNFVKILLTSDRFDFVKISPRDTMCSYVQSMRSSLHKKMGVDLFTAVHQYLTADVEKELDAGEDVVGKLFEVLGQDNIVYIPLILQLIQCENCFL